MYESASKPAFEEELELVGIWVSDTMLTDSFCHASIAAPNERPTPHMMIAWFVDRAPAAKTTNASM
jgi:hypothetical protein